MVSNNFSAVDGRNPGAQIQVITKAGTNQFRGSGSYYFTGNQLSAKNVFETSVPEFSKNQFGYSLGGPIAKNRIFFFTSYEGLRQTGARGSTFTVETPNSATSSCRRARTASRRSWCGILRRRSIRRRTSVISAARRPAPT